MKKLENEFLLSSVQAAYRPRKSTSDHIFVLQELFLEYRFNIVGDGTRRGWNKKTSLSMFYRFGKGVRQSFAKSYVQKAV